MAQPNIILIVVDDMGYGDFGVFSDGSSKTPALDDLVSQGVCFTQHYAGSCVCAPSRAALMTGRYPHRTGAIDTLEGRGLDRLGLEEVTMADLFGGAGYATGLVGKWHLGALDGRYHPSKRGFDDVLAFCGGWQDYYDWQLDAVGNGQTNVLKSDGAYITDVFTDRACDFIRQHKDEPFFLHVTYNAPHFPFQAPEEDLAPFRAKGLFGETLATLYAMIHRMDKGVERIMSTVDEMGLTDNTMFMFTSDNGPQMGGEGAKSTRRHNCGWAGAKGNVYEGGIRVPMIIRWPEVIEAGTRSDALIHYADWLPTLCDVAGVETSACKPLDGHSQRAVIEGGADPLNVPRFWQWNRYTPVGECNAAMRDGDWKLVRPRIDQAMFVHPDDTAMDNGLKYEREKYPDIVRGPDPSAHCQQRRLPRSSTTWPSTRSSATTSQTSTQSARTRWCASWRRGLARWTRNVER